MTVVVEVAVATRELLRLAGGEDALVTRLAATAVAAAEGFCGRALADWAAVPAPVAHGMVVLAAHLFENRGRDDAPPAAVAALWRPYRRLGIGA
jgi:hypothetical protein